MTENLKPVGEVSQLCVYPVKSTYVLNVSAAECTEVGLYLPEIDVYDRQYCILMPNGEAATMTKFSKLTLIKPSIQNGAICLDAPDLPTLQLPNSLDELKGETRKVEVRLQEAEGVDCGDEAGEWVSKHLNKPGARLLRFTETHSERTLRKTEKIFKEQNAELPQEDPKVEQIAFIGIGALDADLAFSNCGPYNMSSEESVEDLNGKLENPVLVKNFRPNIVIKGCKAYEEDMFGKVRIGSAEFKIFANNPRCPITTVNPETTVIYPRFEPLKTLRTYRPGKEKMGVKYPYLSVYMVLAKAGNIKIGDPVYQIK